MTNRAGQRSKRGTGRNRSLSGSVAGVGLVVALLTACAAGPEAPEPVVEPVVDSVIDSAADSPSAASQPPPAPAPAPPAGAIPKGYRDALAAQSLRLRRLQFFETAGQAELRWTDSKGAHFEHCQIDLYVVRPWKTALNIEKVSRIAWIGSDEERWWIFQLGEKPTTVEIRRWDETPNEIIGEGISIVSPRAILELAGMAPLPEIPAPDAERPARLTVTEKPESSLMVVEWWPEATTSPSTAKDPLSLRRDPIEQLPTEPAKRWTIDARTLLPTTIEVLDASGKPVVRSTLADYVSAEIDGAPPGDFPRVPRHVRIERIGPDGQPLGDSLFLAMDQPSGRARRLKDKYFRLNDLMEMFRPDEVVVRVHETGSAGPAAGEGVDAPPASPEPSPPSKPSAGSGS